MQIIRCKFVGVHKRSALAWLPCQFVIMWCFCKASRHRATYLLSVTLTGSEMLKMPVALSHSDRYYKQLSIPNTLRHLVIQHLIIGSFIFVFKVEVFLCVHKHICQNSSHMLTIMVAFPEDLMSNVVHDNICLWWSRGNIIMNPLIAIADAKPQL